MKTKAIGLVFNGEIYNFQSLQKYLQSIGHEFRSRTDSEVVIHAYEEWGSDCIDHLRGMFAFAIYDRRTAEDACLNKLGHELRPNSRGRLFLARDRFGIKPLYYFQADGLFLFASEVRALLASSLIPRRLSRDALESYLLFGSASEPMSIVEGVRSLPPGHRMLVPLTNQDSISRAEPYWRLDRGRGQSDEMIRRDVQCSVDRVRSMLEESVELHLIADVPVGIFLSSGIDSSALAALAKKQNGHVRTFTVAFNEEEFNEGQMARRTALALGTEHQELTLSCDHVLACLEEAVAALDQPSMDGINTYFVSWAARENGLKVALSGLGGDEIFGGYDVFTWTPRFHRLAQFSNKVPAKLLRTFSPALAKMGEFLGRGDSMRKLAALLEAPHEFPHPYFFNRALFTPAQLSNLLIGEETVKNNSVWRMKLMEEVLQMAELDDFTAVSLLEMRSYMVNTLLRDTDSMSMANSLEVRVPFLDHPLVEFVFGLPKKIKWHWGTPKALLVGALEGLLPPEVINQPKRGFTFPWRAWLRAKMRNKISSQISNLSPSLRLIVNERAAYSVWQDFLRGRTSWARPWSLFVLNEWVNRHIDN